MATRFGNTVVVHETMATSRLWFQPDHTFKGSNWLLDVSGTWSVQDGSICLHFDETPPLRSNPECGRLSAHQVGDTWEENGRTYELLEGIHH
ncbi:hypothetical protein [Pararhodospirillum oryzae]|uniref:Uncharacterized protein n=1 Tax=Pararhodospirillum oryzae TaxID=478448 RepID=A0A512H619_9PROT|nr:hypothetical protein [Pararhodospirillum oryzae]GEO80893.1 hypothetical protein ROR02_10240 [Pararhodospirillum oryzae]